MDLDYIHGYKSEIIELNGKTYVIHFTTYDTNGDVDYMAATTVKALFQYSEDIKIIHENFKIK